MRGSAPDLREEKKKGTRSIESPPPHTLLLQRWSADCACGFVREKKRKHREIEENIYRQKCWTTREIGLSAEREAAVVTPIAHPLWHQIVLGRLAIGRCEQPTTPPTSFSANALLGFQG
jgi:hypothetical protein